MIEYGTVEKGAGVLTDSIKGLSDRIKLADGNTTSKQGWSTFKAKFAALCTRIAIGVEGWQKGEPITGLPWGIKNSDQAVQQLYQWSEELETLWREWSQLSGEKLPALASPRDKIQRTFSIGGTLGGISSVIWAVVALSAIGIVGFLVWKFTR